MVEVKETEIFLRSYPDWPAWIEAYERRIQPLSIKPFVDVNTEGPDLVEPVIVTREDYLTRLNTEALESYNADERLPGEKGPPPEPATKLTADQTADLIAIQDTTRLQLQLYSARVAQYTALNDWINKTVDRSWLALTPATGGIREQVKALRDTLAGSQPEEISAQHAGKGKPKILSPALEVRITPTSHFGGFGSTSSL